MRLVKLDAAEPAVDPGDPAGFRAGMARLGRLVGAERTGVSFYELPPGEAICPYHYERSEEEWLLVLDGHPTLRHPGGFEPLEPWDLVFFETGPEGAHQVHNRSGDPSRLLMFSNHSPEAVTVYPDTDKIAVWTADKADDAIFRRADAVDYYDGEG